jgi:hypothetical protein
MTKYKVLLAIELVFDILENPELSPIQGMCRGGSRRAHSTKTQVSTSTISGTDSPASTSSYPETMPTR